MNLTGHKDGNDTGDEEEGGDTDLPLGTRCRLSPMTERAWVHKLCIFSSATKRRSPVKGLRSYCVPDS